MKKNQIKKLVNEAFESVTPSYTSKIKEECSTKIQVTPSESKTKIEKTFRFTPMLKSLTLGIIICVCFTFGDTIKPVVNENETGESSILLLIQEEMSVSS